MQKVSTQQLLAPILSFLKCETPQQWVDEAIKKRKFIDYINRPFDM